MSLFIKDFIDKKEMFSINTLLDEKREIHYSLDQCVSCGICAESCFYYKNNPCTENIPSYKVRNTLGFLYKKKRKIRKDNLEKMRDLLWGHCVLCGRCYCPMGIDLPVLLARTRHILRTQGVYERYDRDSLGI